MLRIAVGALLLLIGEEYFPFLLANADAVASEAYAGLSDNARAKLKPLLKKSNWPGTFGDEPITKGDEPLTRTHKSRKGAGGSGEVTTTSGAIEIKGE